MTHLERTRKAMNEAGVEALLVSSNANLYWLTGFDYDDGMTLVTQRRACLFTDFRYIEACRASRAAEEFEIIMPQGIISGVSDVLREERISSLALEEATVSLGTYERISSALDFCRVGGGASALIDKLREYKDDGEIEIIRRAQSITDAAFAHITEYIRPDMTEKQVALELEFFMRSHGADGEAFKTIAVSGSASSRPHGEPRDTMLEKGFLTMDFGARVDGYCSDMTRTVVIGRADDEMRRLYETVLSAQRTALAGLRAGIGCNEGDALARDIINAAGYEGRFGHSLGHGVGLYIHEAPALSASKLHAGRVLEARQVVTVEPGIYIEGKYGCRIEDMVLVTENGVNNFTASPKELLELCI